MKAEIKEMQELIAKGTHQQMWDYLESHKPSSREEMATYEKLRNKEYSLRNKSSKETLKTRQLLKNSQKNKVDGETM